jgi:hypothetical protein
MTLAKFIITEGHPIVGTFCTACGDEFKPGHLMTMFPIGPGPDPEARKAAREGAPYDVTQIPVCWPCATGEE